MCNHIEEPARWWGREIHRRYIRELTKAVHYALSGVTYNIPKVNSEEITRFEKLLVIRMKREVEKNGKIVISGDMDMIKRIAKECRIANIYIPKNTMIVTK